MNLKRMSWVITQYNIHYSLGGGQAVIEIFSDSDSDDERDGSGHGRGGGAPPVDDVVRTPDRQGKRLKMVKLEPRSDDDAYKDKDKGS